MSYKEEIEKGVELLKLCQQLQSEKDGVDRPEVGALIKSKTIDQFAVDISRAATWMHSLYKLVPLMHDLSTLGRKLEADGEITVEYGEDYPRAVIDYYLKMHGLSSEGTTNIYKKEKS